MTNKTLPEWLDYVEKCHSQAIDMGLARVVDVARRLPGLPPSLLPSESFGEGQSEASSTPGNADNSPYAPTVIVVGGTNGKGSTVAMLEQLASNAGASTGCYTSPHLLTFNERIRVSGQNASDADLVEAFSSVESARESTPLTYFEFTTLVAFRLFAQARLDVWILEVGLGGRLDAVNILNHNIALITSIGLDHQDWLGDTVEKIAREKSGIGRPGKPLLLGETANLPTIDEIAKQKGYHVYRWDEDFLLEQTGDRNATFLGKLMVTRADEGRTRLLVEGVFPALPVSNIALACQAAQLLGWDPASAISKRVLADVQVPGRVQVIHRNPLFVLDVGHNPQAAAYLAKYISEWRKASTEEATLEEVQGGGAGRKRRVIALFSALEDKDIEGVVASIAQEVDAWTLFPLEVPRAAGISTLQLALEMQGLDKCFIASNIEEALRYCLQHATPEDMILAFGSFYTVAAVLERQDLVTI